jgi:endoglucanase
MKLTAVLIGLAMMPGVTRCSAQDWPALWKCYVAGFMDNQIRVIDHDAGDRTTSEGQAYAMFFALVANDRPRFDGLLHWSESNLASGDLTAHLPAWLWGRGRDGKWGVLDSNSASDADIWMAYTLLEAAKAWKEPRYTSLGMALAKRIASEEVVEIPGFGTALLPAATGFQHGEVYRFNPSYLPLQLFIGLGHALPDGPWRRIAEQIPTLVRASSPAGFAPDWVEFRPGKGWTPSALGSYDAIRVYLWAGMLDARTEGRDAILKALPGMLRYLRTHPVPPSKVKADDGSVEDPKSPVGFSAALWPYLSALGEKDLENQEKLRVQSEYSTASGLYGTPPKYYDQNLVLFALGWGTRQFWFEPQQGGLETAWKTSEQGGGY